MAFKLKSGNKISFKEMGSSPLKVEPGLADPIAPLPGDVPSDIIVGGSTAYDPANPPAVDNEEEEKEEEVVNETEESVLPQGTEEAYKNRKERRAEKKWPNISSIIEHLDSIPYPCCYTSSLHSDIMSLRDTCDLDRICDLCSFRSASSSYNDIYDLCASGPMGSDGPARRERLSSSPWRLS